MIALALLKTQPIAREAVSVRTTFDVLVQSFLRVRISQIKFDAKLGLLARGKDRNHALIVVDPLNSRLNLTGKVISIK